MFWNRYFTKVITIWCANELFGSNNVQVNFDYTDNKELQRVDIDDTQDDKVYDILMDADIDTTTMETMAGNNNYKLVEVDDVMHNGEVLVSQETTLERDGNKTVTSSEMSSDTKSLEKALK